MIKLPKRVTDISRYFKIRELFNMHTLYTHTLIVSTLTIQVHNFKCLCFNVSRSIFFILRIFFIYLRFELTIDSLLDNQIKFLIFLPSSYFVTCKVLRHALTCKCVVTLTIQSCCKSLNARQSSRQSPLSTELHSVCCYHHIN